MLEHLLAALLSGRENLAQTALLRSGVDLLALQRTVRALGDPAATGRRPEDDAQALDVRMRHDYIGTEAVGQGLGQRSPEAAGTGQQLGCVASWTTGRAGT